MTPCRDIAVWTFGAFWTALYRERSPGPGIRLRAVSIAGGKEARFSSGRLARGEKGGLWLKLSRRFAGLRIECGKEQMRALPCDREKMRSGRPWRLEFRERWDYKFAYRHFLSSSVDRPVRAPTLHRKHFTASSRQARGGFFLPQTMRRRKFPKKLSVNAFSLLTALCTCAYGDFIQAMRFTDANRSRLLLESRP